MQRKAIKEFVRVLFHLNSYTKIMLERTEGMGLADGGITWDIPTDIIPIHLRKIGSRFIVQTRPFVLNKETSLDENHKSINEFEVIELSDS